MHEKDKDIGESSASHQYSWGHPRLLHQSPRVEMELGPVGDAKVTQVGPGMAGEASPSVKASPAEVTAHQAEGARVKVSHCGDREDIDCLSGGWGVCVCVCVLLYIFRSPVPRATPPVDHTPRAGPHPGCLPALCCTCSCLHLLT